MEGKGPVSGLMIVSAMPFKIRGKSRLSRAEFAFALSLDLKWFTPEQCSEVIESAERAGLLREEGGRLVPMFKVKEVHVPKDFKPSMDVLTQKAPVSLFDEIFDLLCTSGLSREGALELIDEKEKKYGGLLTREAVGLVVAKERGLDVSAYVDKAFEEPIYYKSVN
ncbi:MAG: DUF2240 family protein [Candidatus Doudnabacteria bacterium]